ncbi:hypothetical protein GJ629_12465 [Halapricum sp. CBA1109]|uniref:hypothetical protein n=1 Tax=Halapricum sp. CBA1109 TaxID=2668068 RepID=UPI0012F73D5B|nr:hypothetical protein [Halapricum sp. CBA1109]MUV90610.1 hypothetical protein [Halapricum sp. CBA1109]
MERRRFLFGTAAASTALLAGCSSSDGSTPGETTDESDDPETTAPEETTTSPDDGTTTEPDDGTPDDTPTPDPEPPETPTEIRNGSFEDDLSAWTVGRDLPSQPGDSEEPVDSSIGTTSGRASDGSSALRIGIDGSADDGTVWVKQTVDPEAVSTLRVDGYSEMESFNTILKLATYVGPEPEDGLTEADFDTTEKLADHEGWKTYEYDIDAGDGPVVVAVGLTIVWETGATGVLDNVRLE